MERSIAGQIEYWATLGQAIDPLLNGVTAAKLLQKAKQNRPTVEEQLALVGTEEGNQRVRAYLKTRPYPHFEADPNGSSLWLRTEENGKRSLGRFVNQVFEVVEHLK